jgi:RNA polymerase-binding transcription factor DksA
MLKASQLADARVAIERELARLRGQLADERAVQDGERFEDIAGDSPDWSDRSVADELVESDNYRIGRDAASAQDLEDALRRIDQGSFGVCTDCGKAIAPARLAAYPAGRRCLACQAGFERVTPGPEDDGRRPV